ncbi:MAG: SUMF1/EgtB/PvdO family nonheme iron enzyme [Candidatus Margulisbacteria bacterium]|nr:SUMF1/EgtB/PvdO family nonheme iron enzyme [Candidatus Margulisiibacteriota bacterium]
MNISRTNISRTGRRLTAVEQMQVGRPRREGGAPQNFIGRHLRITITPPNGKNRRASELFVDGKLSLSAPLFALAGLRVEIVTDAGYLMNLDRLLDKTADEIDQAATELDRVMALSANRALQFTTPELMFVPAGSFPVNGSQLFGNQKTTATEVTISQPFYIGRFPVTQGEWAAFDGAQSYSSNHGRKVKEADPDRARHPETNVNDADCQAYVAWLNTLHLTNEEGQEFEFFIPTAAQWEYAARGKDGRLYPWGNEWNEHPGRFRAVYPVDEFSRQESGTILRGTGIVWEKTSTRFGNYPLDQTTDPTGPENGDFTEVRGGSAWYSDRSSFFGSHRYLDNPGERGDKVGFRVAARIKT